MKVTRIHVYLDDQKEQRTTVSMDENLYELLSLYLGVAPDSPDAHKAVRDWAQEQVRQTGYHRYAVSQWLRQKAIQAIVDKRLYRKYIDWKSLLDKKISKKRKVNEKIKRKRVRRKVSG